MIDTTMFIQYQDRALVVKYLLSTLEKQTELDG